MKNNTKFMFVFWGVLMVIAYLDHLFVGGKFESGYNLITIAIAAFFMFAWFLYDARENQIDPSPLLKISVVAFGFIAVPYYLFRYKGIKKAGFGVLKFVGLLMVYVAFVLGVEFLI